MKKKKAQKAKISQPHREARRMARNREGNRREGVATP